MNKNRVYSVILFIVLVGALAVATRAEGVEADATIYIRANGDVEGTDKILRDGNVYTFTDNINDSIVVQKSDIIIDGNRYTLKGSGSWGSVGFDLANISNVTIKDTNIDYFILGVYLNSASQMTISRNNITNNLIGVYISNSFDNTVSGNLVAGGDYGVNIRSSGGNTVSGNNITNVTIYGVKIAESSFNNTVKLNNMTSNYYGVYINTCSFNNTISSNNLKDNTGYGIVLYTSPNNNIHGNNLTNNYIGMYLGNSFDNMVFENTITASDGGIFLDHFSNNTISGNNITESNLWGIRLLGSLNNTISGNNIANNPYQGIWLSESSNNKIYGNDVTDNLYYGINFWNSSNNFIYSNNFVENTNQAMCDSDSVNTWDNGYPSGGNYWSDYTGADFFSGPCQNETGSDFIGDTPFVINSNNTDCYPLMNPYGTDPHKHAYLVVRGSDNGIYYRIYNSTSGSWENWDAVTGATSDSPAAAEKSGELHVVVRGMDGYSLWHGWIGLADYSFTGWTRISGQTPSAPALASDGTNLYLVVQGTNNHVYYNVWNGINWEGWTGISSGSTGDSPAAAVIDGTLHIVVRGYNAKSLWHGSVNLTDNSFTGWTRISGQTPSAPTLASDGTNLYLVVRGTNKRIYYNIWNGTDWEGWTGLPSGTTLDRPAATILDNKLHVVVRGSDGNTLWHVYVDLTTGDFSTWSRISGATPSAPTLTS